MAEDTKEENGYELVVRIFNKFIKPFLAIFIFVLLIMCVRGLIQYQDLQNQINENCGWQDQDYKCYCNKIDVDSIEANQKYYSDFDLQVPQSNSSFSDPSS